jgi:hypothetical protein
LEFFALDVQAGTVDDIVDILAMRTTLLKYTRICKLDAVVIALSASNVSGTSALSGGPWGP